MSRLSPPDHHHSHAEGDGVTLYHNLEMSNVCSARECRDAPVRFFCQSKAGRAETASNHRPQAEDHTSESRMETGQVSCMDHLFHHGTKSNSKGNRKNDDFHYDALLLMSRTRESQGDGVSSEPSRASHVEDQMGIDCHRKKLRAHTPTDVLLKKSRKHYAGEGGFTSSKNEKEAKSSRQSGGSGIRASSKENMFVHLKHNKSDYVEPALCNQKNEKTRSNNGAGRSHCNSTEGPAVAGLTKHENAFRARREECDYSEHSSSKSTSVQESHDMDVLIKLVPEAEAAFSRLQFHKQEFVNASRPDKNSTQSDSFPSELTLSEIQQMFRSIACPGTENATKYHKAVAPNSKMATDVPVCSSDIGNFSDAKIHQAQKNLQSDVKHRPENNVPQEKTDNKTVSTINPSEETVHANESRHTDRSLCSDGTLPTVTSAPPRTIHPSRQEGDRQSSKTKLPNAPPSRETKRDEHYTGTPPADDQKSEYSEHQDSKQQRIHANQNKWTFPYGWSSGEYVSETTVIENNAHKGQNVRMTAKSVAIEENTAATGTKRVKPTKSPKRDHNFEANKTTDCVENRKAGKDGNTHGSRQFDESDTETLDSKSRRLLHQLQMVQICKRKANVLLKHVQSIIDGSHPLGDNLGVNKQKEQCISSKNSEEAGDDPSTASLKQEHKSRPKSDRQSPDRLDRKRSPKIPSANVDEHSVTADKHYKLPVEMVAASKESNSLNLGCKKHETSEHTWVGYTQRADEEMGDKKATRVLGKPEIPPTTHGEDVYEYYKVDAPDKFECEKSSHFTFFDTHLVQQHQVPNRNTCLALSNEAGFKAGDCFYGNTKPRGQENSTTREPCAGRESLDKRHPSTKYAQWVSPATLHGAVSPRNYYENVSNTSESVDSFFVYNDVGSAMYPNSRDFFTKDDKYYHLLQKRGRNSFTRSRSANPGVSGHQSRLDYEQKVSAKGKRHKISRSSMRQSLKEAIKSAKESISAAAKVAEALSFVVKASTDSSTSLSSEADKRPVWKQRHRSKSPAAKTNPSDSIKVSETASNVPPQPSFNHGSVWPEIEEQLYTRSFQENIQLPAYKREKKKLPSPIQQRVKDETYEPKSSAATRVRNYPLRYYQRHDHAGENLRETDVKAPVTSHAKSHDPYICTDISPHTWDGEAEVTKYFNIEEDARIKDGPGHKTGAASSPVLSPKITVQITISKTPESSPPLNPKVNYLADKPTCRKENPTQDACLMADHRGVCNQRPLSEYEQSSELTLSKENWTVSHSCCSSIRKTNSYFNDDNPIVDPLLRDYSSSRKRAFHRHMINAYVDGSTNNADGDSVKYNANVNGFPASKCPMDTLMQNSEQIKLSEKSKGLSTEKPPLTPTGNQRTAEQQHDSFQQACDRSDMRLSHHQNCPANSLNNMPKRPKQSKANLCLSRSYKISHTTTSQGKVNARYQHSLSNQFYNEKVSKADDFLHYADAKSPEISVPVCYSNPSSPHIYNRGYGGLSTSYSGELRSLHEASNQFSQGKTQHCSTTKQYAIQGLSPGQSVFPKHQPDFADTCNRTSYLEYESEHGQTTVYLEIEPRFVVQNTKIQTMQIPKSGVFPLSAPNPSSIEFTAICDRVLHAGDAEGTSISWDNWPQCQINNRGNSNNLNNNNNEGHFSKDDTNKEMGDDVSGIGECLVIDRLASNAETVAGSRLGL